VPGQLGFTLIELMVGVMIGLIASLAVTHVLVNSEGQKRTTTSGSDAQVNGALALDTLQRAIQPAGYGFGAVPNLLGCTLTATFNGSPVTDTAPDFPSELVPVSITAGAAGGPDSLRILASGSRSFSVPARVGSPNYSPAGNKDKFYVGSVRSFTPGDLVVASITASAVPSTPCEVFRVSQVPTILPPYIVRDDDAGWNEAGTPAQSYGDGAVLINMGHPIDVAYGITNGALVSRSLQLADDGVGTPSYSAAVELYPGIVQLQAYYGKDTNSDGTVDTWDKSIPVDNAGWRQVLAVRVAVVSRSTQYEKEEVTFDNMAWDVGTAASVTGAATCGATKCVAIKIDNLPDWKHYRYRLFDTVVPLRNILWSS
jgi:type IV pilus assembly protein PilW